MARRKTIYVCRECGHSASGWLGRCPSCAGWGTFAEEASNSAGQKLPAGAGFGGGLGIGAGAGAGFGAFAGAGAGFGAGGFAGLGAGAGAGGAGAGAGAFADMLASGLAGGFAGEHAGGLGGPQVGPQGGSIGGPQAGPQGGLQGAPQGDPQGENGDEFADGFADGLASGLSGSQGGPIGGPQDGPIGGPIGDSFGGPQGVAFANAKAYRLSEIPSSEGNGRYATGIGEFDRALGGGIVKGSLVLVGGDPGIGKSTLLLQMCSSIRLGEGEAMLYVSGEESPSQLKQRAARLAVSDSKLCVAAETSLIAVWQLVAACSPKVVVIDSIQTMHDGRSAAAPGSVTQIRGVTLALMRIAKSTGVAFVIVGHVTKEGAIAGPKVLEHMVDAVLYFEGERAAGFRILRAVKNRFGSTNEIGVFEMTDGGLAEVANPSAAMIGERPLGVPGSVVVPSVEGTRPMLVEIQALASRTGAPNPRRVSNGVDYSRMSLMAAILEKRAGLSLFDRDVYVNVTGGVRLSEAACDLGVIAAIASSYKDRAFEPDIALVGEVGLAGEVRGVSQIGARVAEAERLGFTRLAIPYGNYLKMGSAATVQAGQPSHQPLPQPQPSKVPRLQPPPQAPPVADATHEPPPQPQQHHHHQAQPQVLSTATGPVAQPPQPSHQPQPPPQQPQPQKAPRLQPQLQAPLAGRLEIIPVRHIIEVFDLMR